MSLDSTDAHVDARPDAPTRARREHAASDPLRAGRVRITDWRLGGRTVQLWRSPVLAVALFAVGGAVLLGAGLTLVLPVAWGGFAATALLWVGMLLAVVWAFTRSRPAGLLRFRFQDLLWGVAFGLILRMTQGWVEVAAGASGALPSYPMIGGALPTGFLFTEVLAPVVIAPVIEEFFFRAVVLISVYTLVRRLVGKVVAGAAAVVASTAVFVILHSLSGAPAVDGVVALCLLGLVCGALVMLTGRIWPAVLVHVVYNGTYVVLALAGSYLG